MAHIALYRKYRPITFSDMIGQEHVINILKKQIETGKISHAYIFSGTRGTGKTSAAKIFARAINCLNPKNGEPCNECEACLSILGGDNTDVVEMDAASNNSVDNIRAIRQEVIYASTSVKYKVYIIDEAHMLSTSAFNALLKTLEEPPENVVFILATTEEHKIIPTILSRCIRFEFKKLTEENIVERLKTVLKDYDMEYEEQAIKTIARLATGALRDALSILERCINNDNKKITLKLVQDIVGIVQNELIEELLIGILEYDVLKTDAAVEKMLDNGKDIRYCLSQLIEVTLDLIMYISGDKSHEIENKLKEVATKTSVARLNMLLKDFSKLDDTVRQATNATVIFKARMIELATDIKLDEKQELRDMILALEAKINGMDTRKTVIIEKEVPKVKVQENVEKEYTEVQGNTAKEKPFKLLSKVIDKAGEEDLPTLASALSGIKAYQAGDGIKFVTDNGFSYSLLKKDDLKNKLIDIVSDVTGKDFEVTVELEKKQEKVESNEFAKLFEGTDVPFINID